MKTIKSATSPYFWFYLLPWPSLVVTEKQGAPPLCMYWDSQNLRMSSTTQRDP